MHILDAVIFMHILDAVVVFSLCYVQSLVCVMCRFSFVLCAVFSLCYVQFLACVMCSLLSRPSSLRSEHASLRSIGCVHACICPNLVITKVGVQIWGADFRRIKI